MAERIKEKIDKGIVENPYRSPQQMPPARWVVSPWRFAIQCGAVLLAAGLLVTVWSMSQALVATAGGSQFTAPPTWELVLPGVFGFLGIMLIVTGCVGWWISRLSR